MIKNKVLKDSWKQLKELKQKISINMAKIKKMF